MSTDRREWISTVNNVCNADGDGGSGGDYDDNDSNNNKFEHYTSKYELLVNTLADIHACKICNT